jgi:hypothetical protein
VRESIKMGLGETIWGGVDWINLAQYMGQSRVEELTCTIQRWLILEYLMNW